MPSRKGDEPVLKLKVRGPGVRRGRIPVPDLIRICQEAQNVITRQAEALRGRKTIHPGPAAQEIRYECTLELVGLGPGSTTLQFGLTKPEVPLPFEELVGFGAEVVTELATTIKSLGTGKTRDIDPGVLESIYSLGGVIERQRVSEIQWIAPRRGLARAVTAPLNSKLVAKVAARLSKPRRALRTVDGVLDMADFKPNDHKCRIDPAIGAAIPCTFASELADTIYRLLRKPVRVEGEAAFQPYADRIESFHIHQIGPLPSLSLGEGNFFSSPSIAELAAAQNVGPLQDMSVLAGGFPADQDIDEFLTEIYEARR